MAQKDFLWGKHVVQGIVPVADAFAGGVSSDVVSLKDYNRVTWLIITGAIEDTGVSNIVTVDACDDTTPTNTTAMPFYHRTLSWSTTVDTWGALTLAAAAGYNLTDNASVANAVHLVTVTGDMVGSAAPGFEYARLTIAETVNKTITAAVLVILDEARYPQAIPLTAIS
jgi:hypothetical protein